MQWNLLFPYPDLFISLNPQCSSRLWYWHILFCHIFIFIHLCAQRWITMFWLLVYRCKDSILYIPSYHLFIIIWWNAKVTSILYLSLYLHSLPSWGGYQKNPEFIKNCVFICTCLTFNHFFLNFKILFIFRGEGKEKQREGNISVWLPHMHPLMGMWPETQACTLTGNRTSNSLISRPMLSPLSYASQG